MLNGHGNHPSATNFIASILPWAVVVAAAAVVDAVAVVPAAVVVTVVVDVPADVVPSKDS